MARGCHKAQKVREIPELVVLLEKDEELPDLRKLPPEKILLRWFNHHHLNNSRWSDDPDTPWLAVAIKLRQSERSKGLALGAESMGGAWS